MPLGSSKFFFRDKVPGSSPPATGYPDWPTLPNVSVLTTFLDKFKFESAPVQANQTYSEWPRTLSNNTSSINVTSTMVPNGNVYMTMDINNTATEDFNNQVWVYDYALDTIVQCNAQPSLGNNNSIDGSVSSILNPYDNQVWLFNDNDAQATTLAITSGSGTISGSSSKFFNRYANGTIRTGTGDSAFYDQAENNVLFVTSTGSPADSKGIYFNMTSGNVSHYAIAETSFSDGSASASGSGTTAICQNPTNGNIYLSFHTNTGLGYSNAIIEWDSSTNSHTEFVPGGSGAAILSGTPSNSQHFGTALLGVDLKMYFLPWDNGNVMILNPADNTATGIPISYKYRSSTLGQDGNIYAATADGVTNASHWLTIDTKPLSATYQTATLIPVATDSNVSYHVSGSTAISRSGKIISNGIVTGDNLGNIATATVNTIQTNGEGWYEVNLNPYFNGQR